MSLNESDTRANLIDPKLHSVGWSNDLISREFPISIGRIEIMGENYRRAARKKQIMYCGLLHTAKRLP